MCIRDRPKGATIIIESEAKKNVLKLSHNWAIHRLYNIPYRTRIARVVIFSSSLEDNIGTSKSYRMQNGPKGGL